MKILLLGFTKLKYMPYAHFYLSNIDAANNETHVVYWNRDLEEEDTARFPDVVLHEFSRWQEDDVSKFKKIASFFQYRTFAKRVMAEESFDLLVVLHTLPGVLLLDELEKRYKGRYVLDYRDSTYEFFPPFRKAIAMLVEGSRMTFVSSDAFRKFLPAAASEKILASHNILFSSLEHRRDREEKLVPSDAIRVAFWGFIRHERVNVSMIDALGGDERFELHYYGREQEIASRLKEHVAKEGIGNVFFHGEYVPDERHEFILQTDVVHNVYCDGNTMLAMGNKYYDGIVFRIPQVCMSDSYMAELSTKAGVGLADDPATTGFADRLFDYYTSLDWDSFYRNCDAELERVLDEYNSGKMALRVLMQGGSFD